MDFSLKLLCGTEEMRLNYDFKSPVERQGDLVYDVWESQVQVLGPVWVTWGEPPMESAGSSHQPPHLAEGFMRVQE